MHFGPLEIDVTRGPFPESFHSVDVVVAEVEGPKLIWGDPDRLVLPRSAAKHFQAIPLLRTGAGDAFAVSDDELALACGSHSAEEPHLAKVASWLSRLGLSTDDLECGPDLPMDEATRHRWLRDQRVPERVANCCSGKHAGFLTVALHHGWNPVGYVEPDHGVQILAARALEEFCDVKLTDPVFGVDGCGVPAFRLPLRQLAHGMARLTRPEGFDSATVAAADRIVSTVASRHFWVAGSNRCEQKLAQTIAEPIVVKCGAEGVFVAALPERGLGIALKVRDGADRAAQVAIAATLTELGVLDSAAASGLISLPIRNKAGRPVGQVRRSDRVRL